MKRSTDRILTTFAGSLVRPPDLRDLVLERDAGKSVDEARLEARVAEAVGQVVRQQVDAGLDVISDGEMSKPSFWTYLNERLTGFDTYAPVGGRPAMVDVLDFPELAARLYPRGAQALQPVCTSPIAYRGQPQLERDLRNFQAALESVDYTEAFLPAATPGMVAYTQANQFYPTIEAYLDALADALRVEYTAIVDAGFVLQLDAPDVPIGRNVVFAGDGVDFGARGIEEYRTRLELLIAACNRALDGIPAERVRFHTCWGNWAGPHHRDVPLSDIIDIVLKVNAEAIYVEAFNPRHEHEWKVWQTVSLPPDKLLIVGMIDTKTNYIEHPDAIAERLQRYARLVGRDRLIAATDCGFGTTAARSTVVEEVAWAKLRSLRAGADLASELLWERAAASQPHSS
ncbi:MAG TPA: cobalamin-independent methionine synthase II family protein [Chloroflexota bacterium]|jgi:5-methyltetrahydropteroyltriglutamate--homocysteine methyltransferase